MLYGFSRLCNVGKYCLHDHVLQEMIQFLSVDSRITSYEQKTSNLLLYLFLYFDRNVWVFQTVPNRSCLVQCGFHCVCRCKGNIIWVYVHQILCTCRCACQALKTFGGNSDFVLMWICIVICMLCCITLYAFSQCVAMEIVCYVKQ